MILVLETQHRSWFSEATKNHQQTKQLPWKTLRSSGFTTLPQISALGYADIVNQASQSSVVPQIKNLLHPGEHIPVQELIQRQSEPSLFSSAFVEIENYDIMWTTATTRRRADLQCDQVVSCALNTQAENKPSTFQKHSTATAFIAPA